MNRRRFLQNAGILTASAAVGDVASLASLVSRKPNFVVVLADDMGFSDAGCFGGEIDTPTIDGLAERGCRFTQMYSTARCGPSRNCLLTGRYAQETAADVMSKGKIPDYTHFIPEYLRTQGYRSYHSGKWHFRLNALADGVGFDRSYQMMDESRYFSQKSHLLDEVPLPITGDGYYSTTAIADYAVDFLRDHQQHHANDPFFLYLAFHSPHFPLQAPQADIDHYRGHYDEGWDVIRERRHRHMLDMGLVNCALAKMEPEVYPPWNFPASELKQRIGPGEITRAVPWNTLNEEQKRFQSMKMSIHAAMITRMDTETNKVLKQLKSMNVFDDTVIIFLSDNGASAEEIIRGDGNDPSAPAGSAKSFLSIGPAWATTADTPLRLHKSYVHEGGISSPMVVSWPNGIRKKSELRISPCHFIDILPTLTELAGGNLKTLSPAGPAYPGKSLVPALRSMKPINRDFLYFNHNSNRAIRMGDLKLVAKGADAPWELYNLGTDRCEQKDLAQMHPDQVATLSAKWKNQDDIYAKEREDAPAINKTVLNKTVLKPLARSMDRRAPSPSARVKS